MKNKILILAIMLFLAALVQAQELNDYPSLFIGEDTVIVVGDEAAPQDVLGASKIASSLGTEYIIEQEEDVFHFEQTGDSLNLYEDLDEIQTAVDEDDFEILEERRFNTGSSSSDYSQEIIIADSTAQVVWRQYDEASDDPDFYLWFDSPQDLIEYRMQFQGSADSDIDDDTLEDFLGRSISILGKEYIFTDARLVSDEPVFTLMSGAERDTITEGQTKTYQLDGEVYEVSLPIVSDFTLEARFSVNGEVTGALEEGDIYKLSDGTWIGVNSVLPSEAGEGVDDLVDFFIGANRIILDGEDNRLSINDNNNIVDTDVTIDHFISGNEIGINSIIITWAPTVDLFVPSGHSLLLATDLEDEEDFIDLLEEFRLNYWFNGIEDADMETVDMQWSNDETMEFTFTNLNGVEYSFPLFYIPSNGSVYLGDDDKRLRIEEGQPACEDDLIAVENDMTTRILEITRIRNQTGERYIEIEDIDTGLVRTPDFDSSGNAEIRLDGYDYAVKLLPGLCVNLTDITDDPDGKVDLWTRYGSHFVISENASYNIIFNEDENGQEDNTVDRFGWSVGILGGEGDFTGMAQLLGTELDMLPLDNDDVSVGYSRWGTRFEEDTSGDQDEWTLDIPEHQLTVDVTFTIGDVAEDSSPMSGRTIIPSVRLADDLRGVEGLYNVILVGGPYANPAVARTSDMFPTRDEWDLDAGEALLQIEMQASGKYAMLVAGTLAEDTEMAADLLAQTGSLVDIPDGIMQRKVIRDGDYTFLPYSR